MWLLNARRFNVKVDKHFVSIKDMTEGGKNPFTSLNVAFKIQ